MIHLWVTGSIKPDLEERKQKRAQKKKEVTRHFANSYVYSGAAENLELNIADSDFTKMPLALRPFWKCH